MQPQELASDQAEEQLVARVEELMIAVLCLCGLWRRRRLWLSREIRMEAHLVLDPERTQMADHLSIEEWVPRFLCVAGEDAVVPAQVACGQAVEVHLKLSR